MSRRDIAFRLEDVGKQYRMGELRSYATLRESLSNAITKPLKRLRPGINGDEQNAAEESFWALEDINLEVAEGEVVGIIGRNGAGKSTLLKLLSRITEPTKGRIELYGRVGSLLEVGTGFHPELTGRENIYLNGAILGMSKVEIDAKFDEIVAFSEVERFLDMPVKRYSSGMYVRLAFSVAAHLEPEILLVDEVLAVGDVGFQQKCLGKMDRVAGEGRAVLFVSHNMGLIQSLCSRAILLRDGTVVADGPAGSVVAAYLRMLETQVSQDLLSREERQGRGEVRLARIDVSAGEEGQASTTLATGRPAVFKFQLTRMRAGVACCFTIYDRFGQPVAHLNSSYRSSEDIHDPKADALFTCRLDDLPLVPGRYRIDAELWENGELQDHVGGAMYFNVEYGAYRGRPFHDQSSFGGVVIDHRWRIPDTR